MDVSYAPRRLALLAACVWFVACASAPEPKATPKRKKHKKHDSDVAEKHEKSSDEDEASDKPDKAEKSDKKKKVADASEDEEEIKVSDDDEGSSPKKKASKKKKAADEKAAEEKERKQREKEEKAEREKEKAEEREREKAAERERKEEAEREKKEAAEREKEEKAEREKAAKAKQKKKQKASEDESDEDSDEVASKPTKAKGKAAKKKTEDSEEVAAEVDMTGDGDGDAEEAPREKPKQGKPAKTKAAAKTKTAARARPTKGTKKKAEEQESSEPSEDVEAADADAEQPVSDKKPAKTGKAAKPKLAKAAKPAKPAKEKPAKADKTEDEGPVIDMEGDAGGDTEEPERRVAAIDVPGVSAENEEPDLGAAKASGEPVAVTASPNSLNDRPLTLAADKLEVHGGLRVNSITLPGAMGAPDIKKTSEGLALGVAYGLGDKAEVGADYTILVNPGTVKGPITFHGAYRAYITPKLEIAAAAAFAIDFDTLKDPVTMKESTVTYAALDLGAWTRYRLGRKLSLISGLPATPSSAASLSKLAFALPPIPYQLAIGLNNDGPIALDLPIGAGYQATGSLYGLVMTDLAHFGIAHSPNAYLFRDIIPLSLGGFYVIDKLDIGLVFSDDFKKDTLRFDTVIRYSIK